MGSYASLSIAGYELLETKSYVDPIAMTVFTESDRVAVLARKGQGAGEAPDPLPPDWTDRDLIELPDDVEIYVAYQASADVVRDRLEVMGVTLAVVRDAFERRLQEQADEIAEAMERDDMPRPMLAQLFREATFLDWSKAFHELMTLPIHPTWPFFVHEDLRTEMMRYVAGQAADGSLFGLPGDARYLLRAAAEVCGPEATVEYEITHLIGGGWYAPNEPVAANAVAALRRASRLDSPTIVLTEGSTDGAMIEGAMALLRPHLVGYLTFMDFERSNAAGGSTALVAAVKAFAGAGIANRVIGLLDNDTAGRAALRTLARTDLSDSIRVVLLPDLPLARQYPTVGPSGTSIQDVNAKAGSIELYFGADVLRDEHGELTPVEWHGFDAAVRAWQGELRDKRLLQARFAEKLSRAQTDSSLLSSLDWTGMELVIDRLARAFVEAAGPAMAGVSS